MLYSWIGGTRSDWRGRGFFRALSEEQEAWAVAAGFDEVLVKTKNRFYDMRGTLDTCATTSSSSRPIRPITGKRRCT